VSSPLAMSEQEAADILLRDPELEPCEKCVAGMMLVKITGLEQDGRLRDDTAKVVCSECGGSQRTISKRYHEAKRVLGVKDGPSRSRRGPAKRR